MYCVHPYGLHVYCALVDLDSSGPPGVRPTPGLTSSISKTYFDFSPFLVARHFALLAHSVELNTSWYSGPGFESWRRLSWTKIQNNIICPPQERRGLLRESGKKEMIFYVTTASKNKNKNITQKKEWQKGVGDKENKKKWNKGKRRRGGNGFWGAEERGYWWG